MAAGLAKGDARQHLDRHRRVETGQQGGDARAEFAGICADVEGRAVEGRLAGPEPGELLTIPVPNTIEQAEPAGVSWTTRNPSAGLASTSTVKPICSV